MKWALLILLALVLLGLIGYAVTAGSGSLSKLPSGNSIDTSTLPGTTPNFLGLQLPSLNDVNPNEFNQGNPSGICYNQLAQQIPC